MGAGERTIDSSIKELQDLQKGAKDIFKFLEGKNLTKEEYETEYNRIKQQLEGIKQKVNVIYDYLKDQQDNITLNQRKAIKRLISSFKELKTGFEGLKTPQIFAESFKELQSIAQIKNGPKSAGFDYELNVQTINKIEPEKMIAQNGTIEYYIVNVPYEGKMVLRIDRKISGEEVALLKINNVNWSDEEIIEEIEAAETNTAGESFKDVEVDGHNAWSTNGETLIEGFEGVQDVTLGAITSAGIYFTGAKAVAAAAGAEAVAATAGAEAVAATATGTAIETGILAGVLGWGKAVIVGGTTAAVGTIGGLPTAVVAGAAIIGGITTAILTDADLTTKRAEECGLTTKLDKVKEIKKNYIK